MHEHTSNVFKHAHCDGREALDACEPFLVLVAKPPSPPNHLSRRNAGVSERHPANHNSSGPSAEQTHRHCLLHSPAIAPHAPPIVAPATNPVPVRSRLPIQSPPDTCEAQPPTTASRRVSHLTSGSVPRSTPAASSAGSFAWES
jgi:hypothetical protein